MHIFQPMHSENIIPKGHLLVYLERSWRNQGFHNCCHKRTTLEMWICFFFFALLFLIFSHFIVKCLEICTCLLIFISFICTSSLPQMPSGELHFTAEWHILACVEVGGDLLWVFWPTALANKWQRRCIPHRISFSLVMVMKNVSLSLCLSLSVSLSELSPSVSLAP